MKGITQHHLTKLKERYIIHEVMGRGENSTVYRAFDLLAKRDVALKAVADAGNESALTQLLAVRSVLVSLADPALVNIDDIGELDEGGRSRLFFTTPLLPGVSLERLIREAPARLNIKAVVRIISQVSRTLHAAHEQGVAHGSLRASSIFAFDDKGVKILDFGLGGPEEGRTPLSDQYALGAVAYHALALKSPARVEKGAPVPVLALNDKVGMEVSQIVRRAMAKQPERRFADLVEFSDALRKAARTPSAEPEMDWARIRPRMLRAELCFKTSEVALAGQILDEVESEGYLDEEILDLRRRVDAALLRIEQRGAIGMARDYFELAEYPKALEKAKEAIELNPADGEALALKNHIEKESRRKQIEDWLALAQQHLRNGSLKQAREALAHVSQTEPENADALRLACELDSQEKAQELVAAEKVCLYETAVKSWEQGEIGSALGCMSLLEAMEHDLPEPRRSVPYHVFYLRVKAESDAAAKAFEVASADLAAGNVDAAAAICRQALEKYSSHPQFLELRTAVENRRREGLVAIIAEAERKAEFEPDLDIRVRILEEAARQYPDEPHFESSLQRAREKRDLVASLIGKARTLEEKSQFADALDRWQIVGSVHARQPGLGAEIGRLIKRRDKQERKFARSRWIEEARLLLEAGDYLRARQAIDAGLVEYPADLQLMDLDRKLRARMAPPPRLLAAPAPPLPVPSLIDSGKQDFVGWCVRQARRLEASGDWAGAMAVVGQGLSASPGDLNLLSLQAELQRGRRVEPVVAPTSTMLERLPRKQFPVITPAHPPPLLRDSVDSGEIAVRASRSRLSLWQVVLRRLRN